MARMDLLGMEGTCVTPESRSRQVMVADLTAGACPFTHIDHDPPGHEVRPISDPACLARRLRAITLSSRDRAADLSAFWPVVRAANIIAIGGLCCPISYDASDRSYAGHGRFSHELRALGRSGASVRAWRRQRLASPGVRVPGHALLHPWLADSSLLRDAVQLSARRV